MELEPTLQQARRRRRLPDPVLRRLLRERAGLTQAEVARLLGVRRPTVTRWETGARRPRGKLAVAYALLLDAFAGEVLRD